MVDVANARSVADALAARLAPPEIAPEFLAEAIWHRILALGEPPSDAEVYAYLVRCKDDGTPVSGRQEHQKSIHPTERYKAPNGVVIDVSRQGRGNYVASYRYQWVDGQLVGSHPPTFAFRVRTRAAVHARVEKTHPGGEWSHALSQRERATILRRWGR